MRRNPERGGGRKNTYFMKGQNWRFLLVFAGSARHVRLIRGYLHKVCGD
jgi:hypothetical protein